MSGGGHEDPKQGHEIEAFGFLASRHPLTLYRKQIEQLRPLPASQMHQYIGYRITMVGWLITEKAAETKQGLPMEFITLEDHTALYDATLFPDVYRRCCHVLSSNRAYVVQGLVEEAFGVATLTVLNLYPLDSTTDVEWPHEKTWYDGLCDAPPDQRTHSSPLI